MILKKQEIHTKIKGAVEDAGYYFIELIMRGNDNNPIFEVFIDNVKGIETEDCKIVSSKIKEVLDLDIPPEVNYRLDVSSPGADRPLRYMGQYEKHLKREFEVTVKKEGGKKKIKGTLTSIDGDKLLFKSGKEEFLIPFDDITSAKVIISF